MKWPRVLPEARAASLYWAYACCICSSRRQVGEEGQGDVNKWQQLVAAVLACLAGLALNPSLHRRSSLAGAFHAPTCIRMVVLPLPRRPKKM